MELYRRQNDMVWHNLTFLKSFNSNTFAPYWTVGVLLMLTLVLA